MTIQFNICRNKYLIEGNLEEKAFIKIQWQKLKRTFINDLGTWLGI